MIFDSIELFLLKCTPPIRSALVLASIVALLMVWWFFGISRTFHALRQLERAQIEQERCRHHATCAQDTAEKNRREYQTRQNILDERLRAVGDCNLFFKRCVEYGLEPENSTIGYSVVGGARRATIQTTLIGSFEHWYELLEVVARDFVVVWKKCSCTLRTQADLEIQAEIELYTK